HPPDGAADPVIYGINLLGHFILWRHVAPPGLAIAMLYRMRCNSESKGCVLILERGGAKPRRRGGLRCRAGSIASGRIGEGGLSAHPPARRAGKRPITGPTNNSHQSPPGGWSRSGHQSLRAFAASRLRVPKKRPSNPEPGSRVRVARAGGTLNASGG